MHIILDTCWFDPGIYSFSFDSPFRLVVYMIDDWPMQELTNTSKKEESRSERISLHLSI